MSQAELAKLIGVDPGVVNSWEKRGTRPSVPNLGRVASALGLAVTDLYRSDTDAAGALVDLRVRAGLSQREAAARLNVSQASVSRWERGAARPTWNEISSYAMVLNTDRITVSTAIDLTANQHGNPPKGRRTVRPSKFTLTGSSPHVIYDFEDTEGSVTLSSPQFPRLAFCTTFNPLMRELAVINEYFKADYFHRYNHMQRRCKGSGSDDAVYLIRWLSAVHETTDYKSHPRGITAAMLVGQVAAVGFLTVGSKTLPTGEYLIIVVEPEDTLEFLFGQISRDVPVTFFPTRRPDGIGPLDIFWEKGADSPTGWRGNFLHGDMPADMTFADLFRHLSTVDPPTEMAAKPGTPQIDAVRSIHRKFGKSTLGKPAKAPVGSALSP